MTRESSFHVLPFRKRRRPPMTKWSESLLVALVKEYERTPGMMVVRGFGETTLDLAVKAHIVSEGVFESHNDFLNGNDSACFEGVYIANLLEKADMMRKREWAETKEDEDHYERRWHPTPAGIDHARRLMRPWWVKFFDGIKGDVRTSLVSVVFAILTTLLTTLILKLFGWFE